MPPSKRYLAAVEKAKRKQEEKQKREEARQHAKQAPAPPAPAPPAPDDFTETLVSRLLSIRERIWRLQAMFAVTLSQEVAIEANRYLALFQAIADELRAKDACALEAIVQGHEALLQSPSIPIPAKQSIPLATQELCELRWNMNTTPRNRPAPTTHLIPDGLGWIAG